jgi:hypothetical protein
MHDLTEAHDRGEDVSLFSTPEELRDVQAYAAAMKEGGVKILPEYIERFVAIPEFKVCGKLDRIVDIAGELLIDDVKTAKNVDYGWLDIVVQLALYSMASHYWDEDKDDWVPMPAVSQDKALVAHLPVGRAQCDLYEVDLVVGREACEVIRHVRALRSNKSLARPIASSRVESPYAARLRSCAGRDELSAIWKEATAEGAWTKELEMIGMARMKEIA